MRINLITAIAIITILISLITWTMDLFGIVHICINCRTERTIIGILGLILLLPHIPLYLKFLSFALGFFGCYVASEQLFGLLKNSEITGEFFMASCALIILIIQIFYIHFKDDVTKR